ncbi:TPA: 2,3-diaminopropionate biosynthesis protein SbnB [Vibrio cholerae]|uniref:2,3-diaminopropionate biosynthesis protein SbnB n=1 Tax=Vibrio cholerae TaxID=666 RepID=UPI00226F6D83|nr:2,3-diaminopropionate biosynthesis protein SbnB [Vibrio cholerae]MCX9439918.1 2,3-diaminopropionate biosynthesis protein SbnB [Vibrio cholerae]HDI3164211.1 2,3-diaminopropionate biosynthesis protein SbnB [Vibrio cholerae]
MDFKVISGTIISEYLKTHRTSVLEAVRAAYISHERELTENPTSHFLQFKNNPSDRIIALLASINDERPMSGMKWIASYPGNLQKNIQRASATMILNDASTGYPLACLEASQISSSRTAASAAIAASLYKPEKKAKKAVVVGCGIIAREILNYLKEDMWSIDSLILCDINSESADKLKQAVSSKYSNISTSTDLDSCVSKSDLVIFATNAGTPYFDIVGALEKNALVLHISLRDISVESILNAVNIVDDIEHCLKANTSPHLAEQKVANRDFIHQTLPHALVNGAITRDKDDERPIIVSPFGMGILDLAVARNIYEYAIEHDYAHSIPDFFSDISR